MRSRSTASPVTFFSFQDVLLSLIGITVVIAIILMLQVSRKATEAIATARASSAEDMPLDERERNLRDTVAALEQALARANDRPDVDPLARRSSLRQELLARAGDLGQLEAEIDELKRQMNELLLGHPDAGTLREVLELIRVRDARAAELDELERVRRISYIVDDALPVQPVIFEVSDRRIVISELGARYGAVRIPAGTLDAAVTHAMMHYAEIAKGRQCYVLIVLKPSGLALFAKLRSHIDSMPEATRPRIGLDLVPESSFISENFPGSAVGGRP